MFDTYSDIFADRAASYHSAMKQMPNARSAEFQAVLAPINDAPAGLVCDMPSGGCYLMPYLPAGMRYVGVDPVPTFSNSSVGTGAEVFTADLVNVPLASGTVDYVISLAGLHHEENLVPVFEEMRRLVAPHGRVIIADVAAGTPPATFLNGFVDEHNPLGHKGHFFDEKTREILESAWLTVEGDEIVEMPWAFSSVSEAGAFCGKLFGIVDLDPEEIAEGLESIVGFDQENGRPQLRWALRRIVCALA